MGELLELEHAWGRACQLMDLPVLQSLLAPEFRLSFAEDPRAPRVISREEWFATLDKMSLGSYSIVEQQEAIFGNRGVMHMRLSFHDWRFDGTLLPADYVVTDIFVKRQGCWQVINRISEGIEGSPHF